MNKRFINSLMLALGFLAAAHVSFAMAEANTESLGAQEGAIDRYEVVCSTGVGGETARVAARVRNTTSAAPLLSVQVYKEGFGAANATDESSEDAVDSPWAYVYGGNATYYAHVDKTGAGAADYTLTLQCETQEGAATGTAIHLLQDQ